MHIEEIVGQITPINEDCVKMAQARFDALIKPVGSLDKLEKMTSRYAGIIGKYKKEDMDYPHKAVLVWCGIEQAAAAEEVMRGALPINVLARSAGADAHALLVVSENFSDALEEGAALVQELVSKHEYGMLGFGCLAGSNDNIVQAAMAGGMLQAAALKLPIMLDGVAGCTAAAKAIHLAVNAKEYFFAAHVSAEPGGEAAVQALGLEAPLQLNIPDGAGEGAAIAFNVFDAGIKAYKEMETFEEAGVEKEVKSFSRREEKQESHWRQEC